MKAINILSALFLFLLSFAHAQMDDKFYQPGKKLKPLEFSKPEYIAFPVEQDTVTAYVVKPETKKIKKTILFFHGAGGNVTTYQYITKPLVDAGFQVVMIDFRGYGKSTGKPTHLNVAADGQMLFDKFINRPDIKNTKVYIYGASLGSQIATHLAKDNVDKISGLILDSPMASFTDIAAFYAPQYKDMILKGMPSPYSAKEDIKGLGTLPKIVIHSKEDKEVPYEQGKLVFDNASQPKQFIESAGAHLGGMQNNTEEILKAIQSL
ncbi:lysophospholipase [Elizabethkingia meningoseptica]|uniref:Alpha/beta hydrolase n=1 Tax=Elizabethkingia meningoseptica TaxID=238 RepID=A0A1V3U4Q5_ELIME|nr:MULTISPECIES: alpha/beta fold hydrolase [Elizabethkingia]AQX11306.1 alpha/beta hydrolase [Elizabethkingia meningoseptica]MBG0512653.1 alpha/beta fold hydrolase [Elizabethkingia meningoseptica]MCL1674044.1 lysophospholipase [Elizabethkingia meningoseptica]MCL1685315.1 lysophospholipase [Elizabethkingia meningoseptica]MDE5435255.1 lysophospholipase [Elizabethkingia meningoseptica]